MTEQSTIEFDKDNLDQLQTGNKLLLLQAINSFEHGLQCLEWMTDKPNECTTDALIILRDRFQYFKECALTDKGCDFLIIDKMKKMTDNIEYGYEINKDVKAKLSQLRQEVVRKKNELN